MDVQTWERRSEWPLAAVALTFLVAYAWPVLDPGLSPALHTSCVVAQVIVWIIFVVDYLARAHLSPDRAAFVRGHLIDLAVIVLPMLRPLRLLRVFTILNVFNRGFARHLRGRVAIYAAGASLLVIFVGGIAMLDAERDAEGATITTAGDAFWWAVTTITTVGYGDRYPVTGEGRLVAVSLMVCGIALIGVVTASLATWLLQAISEEEAETRDDLDTVLTEVRELRIAIDTLRPAASIKD